MYFYFRIKFQKTPAMRLELNNQNYMQFKTLFNKFNPWIGLIASLCLIIPSLYDILDDPLLFTTDHLILAVGVFFMILFLKQIFDRIINLEGME
jgi:hypothetical protein